MRTARLACLLAAVLALARPVSAQPATALAPGETVASLRLRAYDAAYNLDYDRAIDLLRAGTGRWPENASVYRSLATMVWLQILFARGSLTVDDYLGPLQKQYLAFEPPPPELAARFREYASRAVVLAERQLARAPSDLDALYERGAAVGLQASYAGTIEGRMWPAFRQARRAYLDHAEVQRRDPRRKEAGLIVGTYQYVTATLSAPLRWMARFAGFTPNREHGVRNIREAAQPGSDAAIEATFGLIIIMSRERRYVEALACVNELRAAFPRNRLLTLEAGATNLRARRPADAERDLEAGMAQLARDPRPRLPGEEALWRLKRGTARVALARPEEARRDLTAVLASDGRNWIKGRARTELARLDVARGDRASARRQLELARTLCVNDNDPVGARDAAELTKTAGTDD
jgi:hypothetical protein